MSTAMFRVLLVLVTVPLAIMVVDNQLGTGLLRTGSATLTSSLNKPSIEVLGAPTQLVLDEPGVLLVRATAPAKPGDTIYLESAGAYGMGYYRVDKVALDENLEATLKVAGRPYLGTYKYWARIVASGSYQEGKSQTVPISIVSADAPAAPDCGGGEQPVKPDGTPWVCTYSDEFETGKLDRRFWAVQKTRSSGFVTGTKTNYACAEDMPETVGVSDGNLQLSLVDLGEVRSCGKNKKSRYAFGQVMHFQTYSQTYGKYEVRAKIPEITVPGVQQSFWLWPKKNTYGGWPASGEIDFAEMYSFLPGLDRPYIHYLPGETESGTNKNVTHADCQINVGKYNTYGVEWEPGRITTLLNGEVCFVNDYSSITAKFQGKNAPFDKPFYLSLNQAMGTTANEYDPDLVPDTVTTQVDYVRIWK